VLTSFDHDKNWVALTYLSQPNFTANERFVSSAMINVLEIVSKYAFVRTVGHQNQSAIIYTAGLDV